MTYAGSAYGAAPYAGAASEGTPGEQYSAEVLADSPSLYWRFSETSGTAVADSSGNARAGTIDNANHTRNAPSLLTTSSDPAMTLTGGNSIVSNEADVAWINIPAFTAEVVFKANSFAGQPLIMAQDNDGVSTALRWRVYVDPATGKLQCVMVNTASAYVTYDTGIVLSTGTTYYVALTYASGTMTFYVNGVAATPYSVDLKASGQAPLRLGGARSFHTSGTYSGTYNGTLDEFAYYPTALSAARIAAHHAAGTGTAAVPAATATGSLSFGGTTGASGAMAATGSLSLGGTGGGEGQATASGSLTLSGGATSGAEASAAGALSLTASVAATAASSFTGSLSLSGVAASAGPPSAAEVVETKAARSASPSVSFTNAMAAGDVVVIAVAGGLNAIGATYAASGLGGTWTSEVIANTGNTASAVLVGRGVSGTGSITVTGTSGPFDFWAFHLRGFPGTVAYTASQSRVRYDATALDRTVGPYGATSGQFIVAAGSAEGASTGNHALTPTSPAKENWTLPAPSQATTGETWSNDGGRIAYRQATTAGDHTVALTGSDSHLALVMLAMDSSAPATGPAAAGSLSFGGAATSGARSVATGALSLAGSATSAARATATGSLAFGGTAGVRAGVQMVHRLSAAFNPITDPTRHFTWSGDFPNAVAGDVLVVFTTETDAPAEWTGPAPWNNNVGNGVLNYGDLGSESFMTPLNTFPVTWRLHVVRLEEHQVSSGGFYLNNQPTAGAASRITYSMHVLRGVNNFPGTAPINYLSQNDTYYNAQQPVQWAAATATILNPVMTLGIALSDDADVWDGPDGDLWPESPMVVGPQFRHYAHVGFSNQNRAADSDPATAMSWATWQREFTSVPENVSAAGSLSLGGTAGAATGGGASASSASGSLSFGGTAGGGRRVIDDCSALTYWSAPYAGTTVMVHPNVYGDAVILTYAAEDPYLQAAARLDKTIDFTTHPTLEVRWAHQGGNGSIALKAFAFVNGVETALTQISEVGPYGGPTVTRYACPHGVVTALLLTAGDFGNVNPGYDLYIMDVAQVDGGAVSATVTATGSLSLSGSAGVGAPAAPVAAQATGSLALSGSAGARGRAVATGSLALSGTAGARGRAVATGSLAFTGTAVAAGGGTAAAASGSLTLVGEGFAVEVPPAYLLVRTPVLDQPPGTIQVIMSNLEPLAEVTFRIDSVIVGTGVADSQGDVDTTSLLVDRQFGAGTHTVSGTTSGHSASATFSITTSASSLPTLTAADAPASDVPGAVIRPGHYKWVFQDPMPGGLGSWVMPIGPSAMKSPHVRKNVASSSVTSPQGVPHVTEGARPLDWEFSGFCPDEEFQDKLIAFSELNRRFYVIDHRNRAWVIAIQSVDIQPRRRVIDGAGIARDWYADYTIKAALFSQTPEQL